VSVFYKFQDVSEFLDDGQFLVCVRFECVWVFLMYVSFSMCVSCVMCVSFRCV